MKRIKHLDVERKETNNKQQWRGVSHGVAAVAEVTGEAGSSGLTLQEETQRLPVRARRPLV